MTHHTHFVQTGLSVEQDKTGERYLLFPQQRRTPRRHSLSVFQVPLDDPPILQKCVCTLVISQVYPLPGVSDDVTCTWVRSGPIPYKFLKISDIVWSDCSTARRQYESQQTARVDEPRSGYVRFIAMLLGTPTSSSSRFGSSDDGSCGKIDTLPHQVSSQTTFFAF